MDKIHRDSTLYTADLSLIYFLMEIKYKKPKDINKNIMKLRNETHPVFYFGKKKNTEIDCKYIFFSCF